MSGELFDLEPKHPGEVLKRKLLEKGWTQPDLALITGKSLGAISDIARGRGGVSPDMAVAFAAAFGDSARDWLQSDLLYRLHNAERDSTESVRRAAKLHELAPIKDMQKRGWLRQTKTIDELERELKTFFDRDSLDGDIPFTVATRRPGTDSLNPAERAWCFRAKQLAATMVVPSRFSRRRLAATERKLRQLAAFPKEARHLPKALGEAGIRFVVIETLPSARIDGAAFWLDENSPVIAVSIRYDRIDWFWFTVMHEFRHVCNGDALSVDTDLVSGEGIASLVEDETERRANEEAAAALIPGKEFQSFIRRVGPLYSRDRIIQFAHKTKIHPGIVVGQLQKRDELGYGALRELLVKIRSAVISTALTDGWGQTVALT